MLPNFLIIGAMKAGTTSLYEYLREHPQVFMATPKELHFFVEGKNWQRGRAWYERKFEGARDAVAVGEASPDYTKHPIRPGVPERIVAWMPRVRLVYLLRHPVERARSHYLHDLASGRERRPIEQVLPGNSFYLDPSRYAMQIEQYLRFFEREQLLLATSEDLRHRQAETLRGIYSFLGVDPDWESHAAEREYHHTTAKGMPGPLLRAARRVPGASAVRLRAPRVIAAAERALKTGGAVDPSRAMLSPDLRARLEDELRADVAELRQYMPPAFDGWGLA
jgi:Sulfotransferase domain